MVVNKYSRPSSAILLSLFGSALALLAMKNTEIGRVLQAKIPFGDLWICLSFAIMGSLLASVIFKIENSRFYKMTSAILFCGLLGIVYGLVSSGAFEFYFADSAMGGGGRREIYLAPLTWLAACAWAIAASICVEYEGAQEKTTGKLIIKKACDFSAVAFSLWTAQYCILVNESPYSDNPINLGVVLMPVINLFHGALPPLDVQSQYGYYAYLMVPFLKIFGLSVFSQSFLFAALFGICIFAIYLFTASITRSSIVALTVVVAAFFLNTSFGNIWPAELYYQYRPIRMLAPCVSILLFLWVTDAESAFRRVISVTGLSALVIWNSDSGIPTLAAFLIVDAFGVYFKSKQSAWLRVAKFLGRCGEAILVFSCVMALFAFALFLVRGEWITPAMVFEPMRVFRLDEIREGSIRGYFSDWSQAILLPTLLYFVAVAFSIHRGVVGIWSKRQQALLLVGLTGLGIATYGTTNPQAAALTSYMMPVTIAVLAVEFLPVGLGLALRRQFWSRFRIDGARVLGRSLFLMPLAFLALSYGLHMRQNLAPTPSIFELIWPSQGNTKGLWIKPGTTDMVVDYVRINDIAAGQNLRPSWFEKAQWLKSLSYLSEPQDKGNGGLFIASVHDHYLYTELEQSTPIRIINYYHIAKYKYWSLLYKKTSLRTFDYIVVDDTYLVRNSDPAGHEPFENFLALVEQNYIRVESKVIGSDWNYPGWKPSQVSVYKSKGSR